MKGRGRLAAAGGDLAMLGLAAGLVWASFAARPAEVYLFPRILAVAMLGLAAVRVGMALFEGGGEGDGGGGRLGGVAWAGVAVIVAYVGVAEWMGFYAATGGAFFALVWVGARRRWSRRAAGVAVGVAGGAVAVLYGLFSVLLRVQIPMGGW